MTTAAYRPREDRAVAATPNLLRRAAPWLAMLPMVLFAAIGTVVSLEKIAMHKHDAGIDLNVYLRGLGDAASGVLYTIRPDELPYNYPASSLFVLGPLTWVPGAELVWLVASTAMVAVSAWLVLRAVRPGSGLWAFAGIAGLVILSWPATSALLFGQVGPLLVALVVVDALVLSRTPAHGALIGVAAAVKLTPLLFIPWLWLIGRRRAAVVATGVFVAMTAASVAAWPSQAPGYIRHLSATFVPLDAAGNVSATAVAHRFGAPSWLALPLTLLMLVGALLVARRGQRVAPVSSMLLVGCASAAAAPIGWIHGWIWLPLLAVAIWSEIPRARAVSVFAVWAMTLTNVVPMDVRVGSSLYLLTALVAAVVIGNAEAPPAQALVGRAGGAVLGGRVVLRNGSG